MNIAIVMPRFTSFGRARATSIDLCVRDLVEYSRHRHSIRVICDKVEEPFPGISVEQISDGGFGGPMAKAWRTASLILQKPTDLVIVQQHLPTAFVIAKRLRLPVLYHTHNFQKRPTSRLKRALRSWRYAPLAGMVMVSDACIKQFNLDWPDISLPTAAVNNGLDMEIWRPETSRAKEILIVGRAAPEKGVLEAVRAAAEVLRQFPEWKVRCILSESVRHPDYFVLIKETASAFPEQMTIMQNQTYDVVKQAYERAAIAMVLSRWDEPFGRTALEAHAGGAALISSGTGGLAEISGPSAIIVDPDDHARVVDALSLLASDDELRIRLACEGRARVASRFDIRNVASSLDDFCETITEVKRCRATLA